MNRILYRGQRENTIKSTLDKLGYSRVSNNRIPNFGFFGLNFENLNRYKMNSVEV